MAVYGRNSALDGVRGFAVLLVFFVHYCGGYLRIFRGSNANSTPLHDWPDAFDKTLYILFRSHQGVFLFFVLSGFLIARLVLSNDFDAGSFAARRILRIYPAFLLALVVCIGVGYYVRHTPLPSPRDVALNLFFLNGAPVANPPVIMFNNVSWSLFYEAAFYVILPLVAFVAARIRLSPAYAFVLAGLAFGLIPEHFGFWTRPFLCLFAGAVIGALDPGRLARLQGTAIDVIGVGAYFAAAALYATDQATYQTSIIMFAVAGSLVLVGALSGRWLPRFFSIAPLVWLGTISYSFYLLHSVALALAFLLQPALASRGFGPAMSWLVVGIVGFLGALGLAVVSFVVAEWPYFKLWAKPITISRQSALESGLP
jgi:peptidoglycan/LPS O-acetylase OafA/YrhL